VSEIHVTLDDLRALQQSALPKDRIAAVLNHVAGCTTCATTAARITSLPRAARDLAADAISGIDAPLDHPDERELFAYVDGMLPPDSHHVVARHLAECELCRQDVADVAAVRRSLQPPRRRRMWLEAAMAAVAVVATAAIVTWARMAERSAQAPVRIRTTTAAPSPGPSTSAVADAVVRRELTPPAEYLALQRPGPRLRGNHEAARGQVLAPVAERVESARPEFSWTTPAGMLCVVSVFDGRTIIAQSGAVRDGRWRPDRDLPRGRIYTWQVAVTGDGVTSVIPPPQDRRAELSVISAEEEAALVAARAATPHDHLALAVLYASSGLKQQAHRELATYVAANPGDPAGRALLASLKRWPGTH
jgi:anti-sigma factor RsiW